MTRFGDRRPRTTRPGRLDHWIRSASTFVAAAIGVLLFAFPLYWILANTLQPPTASFSYPPELVPSQPTLNAFGRVFVETDLLRWLVNTTIVAGSTAVLAVVVGTWGGYSFSRFRSRGLGAVALLVLSTQLMPHVVIMIPLYRVFLGLGLNDSLAGLVVANFAFALPVTTWMIKTGFDRVPIELDEAALVDGSGRLGVIARVAIPLALPSIVAAAIFAFIEAWQEFLFARTLIRDPEMWVGSIGIASFFGARVTLLAEVMTAAFLFSLPPIVLFLVLQRHFAPEVGAGAVKG